MSSISSTRRTALLGIPLLLLVLVAVLAALAPSAGGAATLRLPKDVTKQQAYSMYAEQLDSRRAIGDLVDGDIKQFTVLRRTVSSSAATLTLEVRYKNGFTRRGSMRLFKAGDAWYLKSITHHVDSTEHLATTERADIGVVNTILAEQIENKDIASRFVSGSYTTVKIGKPKTGYRSVDLPVTLSGRSKSAAAAGRITCVSRSVDGDRIWFITGFSD